MAIKIIAELAQGYEGRPEQARLLMRAAANSGADAVKYQLVYADELATPDYEYYSLFKSLEMANVVWKNLADYAEELNVELHFDIFGAKSLNFAESIGVKTIKLHGTDISNIALLNLVSQSSVPNIFLGAGGAYLSELEIALKILKNKQVCVFTGFQGYPTRIESNQISRIEFLSQALGKIHSNLSIGFADHADPEDILKYALPAVALGNGATVFEKHLTLGKKMKLEDYEAALNPDEFSEFSRILRDCHESLGILKATNDFGMTEDEISYRKLIRRHVVSAININEGATLMPSDLVLKRTSSRNFITDLNLVYGKTTKRFIPMNTSITPQDIN